MFSSPADDEHLVVDAPASVPQTHVLFSAADEEHLVVDSPALVAMNSLKFRFSAVDDKLGLVLSAYLIWFLSARRCRSRWRRRLSLASLFWRSDVSLIVQI